MLLDDLGRSYLDLRCYREAAHIYDQNIKIQPDRSIFKIDKANVQFCETGDLSSYRSVLESQPDSIKDNSLVTGEMFDAALSAHDWAAAKKIISAGGNQDLFIWSIPVPRACAEVWLAAAQGTHPSTEGGYGLARNALVQKVQTYPEESPLLSMLGVADAFLGRKMMRSKKQHAH
jgi:hypothetical protein